MLTYIPITEETEIKQNDLIRQPQEGGSWRYIRIGTHKGNDRHQVFLSDKNFESIGYGFYYDKESMIAQRCEILR